MPGGRRLVAVGAVAVPDGPHHGDAADAAGVDEPLLGLDEVRIAALLRAGLQDTLVLPHRAYDLVAFHRMQRQRLFDVQVLARPARGHGDLAVHVVPRGDDDGVDILAVEDLAVINVLVDRRAGHFFGAVALHVVSIGDRHPLDVPRRVGVGHQISTSSAAADNAETDAVIGAQDPAGGCRRHGPNEAAS